ncbi:MAG: ribbon-helix-helix protein, CopG family [Thermoplasmata archaeon]|nr:ribbon-helix-helix protein, CopG family [Thermoplasmata archaeon]
MAETERVTIRLPKDIVEKLELLVQEKKYETKSDVIRAAIDQFLKKEIKPPNVERLTVEVPKGNLTKLQELVEAGDSVSIDDAVREAIREYTRMRIQKMIQEYEELKKIRMLESSSKGGGE